MANTVLQQQLADAVKGQIALRSDFADDGIIGIIVDTIHNLFGVDLSAFFETVDGILAPVNAVVNQVIDVFNGLIVTPINNAIVGLIDWFTGNNTDRASALSKADSALLGLDDKASQVELAALQDRTQKLEGVIGYGHAYCSGGVSLVAGDRFVPMDVPIGPSVGITRISNYYILNSKGLWAADASLTFDFLNVGVVYANLQIRVYNPDGSGPYFQRFSEHDNGERQTHNVHMPFTVPTAGYIVAVYANAASGRGIKGGSQWNGFSLTKISTEDT